jgi:uncharacterized repeat protein (TIGR03803 family)
MIIKQAFLQRVMLTAAAATFLAIAPLEAAMAQTYKVLYSFLGGAQGYDPAGKPLLDGKGHIFGTTIFGGAAGEGLIFSLNAKSEFSILYSFLGAPDGSAPLAGLAEGSKDHLFGTASGGGTRGNGGLFEIGTDGNTYRFEPMSPALGEHLYGGLVQGTAGSFFGLAGAGGAFGMGAVFSVSPTGTIADFHSFAGGADGAGPGSGNLAEDASGNLYGTTESGGTGKYGVLFKLTPQGAETILYTFRGKNFGGFCIQPNNSVALDSAGNIYGSTIDGSGPNGGHGCVYKLSPEGQFTVLHYFTGNGGGTDDGAYPMRGVSLDAAGNIYGTTLLGGYDNLGTIYRIGPSGRYTLLHSFENGVDGVGQFVSELTIDPSGPVLGVNQGGGAFGYGNLFEITQ